MRHYRQCVGVYVCVCFFLRHWNREEVGRRCGDHMHTYILPQREVGGSHDNERGAEGCRGVQRGAGMQHGPYRRSHGKGGVKSPASK